MENLLKNQINYDDLGSKEQEAYNYTKVASVLSDYGFHCMYNHVDRHGADLIAIHTQSGSAFSLQLKGSRPTIAKKYMDKKLWIVYTDRASNEICLYDHDKAVALFEATDRAMTESWAINGQYSFSPTKRSSVFEEITIRLKIN